ncbi:hypothetical protein M2351_005088 [Azospirillum canadense]|nr:hypothetical protein [Azospirillum canadense]
MVPLIEHRDRNSEGLNKETLDTKSPIQANETHRQKIPDARRRVANWAPTMRRCAEGAPCGVDNTRGGRGVYAACHAEIAIETGPMLRLASGRLWPQTEALLDSLMRLLGLDLPFPDHTTFSQCNADWMIEVPGAMAVPARFAGPT